MAQHSRAALDLSAPDIPIKHEPDMPTPRNTRASYASKAAAASAAPAAPAPEVGDTKPKRQIGEVVGEVPEPDAKRAREGDAPPAMQVPGVAVNGPARDTRVSALFCDPKGEFEIISKEGISHRVRSYHLLSNSPFFQELHDQDRMSAIYHAPSFPSDTIEDILSLMTRRPLLWTLSNVHSVHRTSRLVDLCNQWRCDFLLERVSATLRDMVGNRAHGQHLVFACAAILNDHETCKRVIPAAASTKWEPIVLSVGETLLDRAEAEQSLLDVVAMPQWQLNLLPRRVQTALGRAYRLRGHGLEGSQGDWEKVAAEYYRLMTLTSFAQP